jgi:uncharacterized membrane protein
MEIWQLMGSLHPKLVQFPLVLLLAGLVFDLIGLVRRSARFSWAGVVLSSAGTVFLLFAFICGIYAEIGAGRAGVPQDPIEWHEFVANISSWGFVVLTAARILIDPTRRRLMAGYVAAGIGFYVLLIFTAYYGGQLVFQYGAAVSGVTGDSVHSIHDLNSLAVRQTDENLKYSEMMHHIFGWMTLGLSGSLLAQNLFPIRAKKLRWVVPSLLLVGGVFLFFFADLDLYRLTDPRQWGDREVELHKTIALILFVVGLSGLTRKSNADETAAEVRSGGSKPIAVMALIGGGLLFTHVHTVAPYANVAAGVYIAHVVLGMVALSIGAARLLQDGLPNYRRQFAVVFAGLMCVESMLLISYNEGLPWYIGYGRYNRWGPHGGTVAPFGPWRAELTFNNADQTLHVFPLDRYTDTPAAPPAGPMNLLIGQGYRQTVVGLHPTTAARTEFVADAPWLKNIDMFSARLATGGGTGFFDPWVTPAITPVPPNEVAKYQCPMHDGIVSEKPGVCPLCQMQLVPIQTTVRTVLHDPPFELDLAMHDGPSVGAPMADASSAFPTRQDSPGFKIVGKRPPSPGTPGEARGLGDCPRAGRGEGVSDLPVPLDVRNHPHPNSLPEYREREPETNLTRTMTFTPRQNGRLIDPLPVVHEHPMHVSIVSDDLEFFDHVHPIPNSNGTLSLTYTFPAAGRYIVFAEFMPAGQRDQIFRFPVTVGDPPPRTNELLIPTPAATIPIATDPAMTAELTTEPRTLTAGTHAMLIFRLTDHGQPVVDLRPYMAAMGHCAIVSQDTRCFLHCHPEQLQMLPPDARGGPVVAFHAAFPAPGRYKIWGQFKRGDKVIVAPFVVDVQQTLLPARVINFILNDY